MQPCLADAAIAAAAAWLMQPCSLIKNGDEATVDGFPGGPTIFITHAVGNEITPGAVTPDFGDFLHFVGVIIPFLASFTLMASRQQLAKDDIVDGDGSVQMWANAWVHRFVCAHCVAPHTANLERFTRASVARRPSLQELLFDHLVALLPSFLLLVVVVFAQSPILIELRNTIHLMRAFQDERTDPVGHRMFRLITD